MSGQGRTATEFFWGKAALRAKVSAFLGRSSKDRVGNIRKARIELGHDVVEMDFAESGIEAVSVMGKSLDLPPRASWYFSSGKLFSSPHVLREISVTDEDGEVHDYVDFDDNPFSSNITSALRAIAHGRTSDERLESIANRLLYARSTEFFDALLSLPGVSEDLRSRLESLGPDSVELTELRRSVLSSKITMLVQAIDDEVAGFASSIKYVEPLRATAERYYRQQDLAVDEVDSRGGNTAMFIESLPSNEIKELQGWMKANLGFWIVVEAGVGHVQLKIQDDTHAPRNIADLGFGYSQILPIALQLWKSSRSAYSGVRENTLLAIEQPELHLHPEYQARLADVIASCAKVRTAPHVFRTFIETHSDHLINRFGKLVAQGEISSKDIQVIVVCDSQSGVSEIRRVSFTSDGYLGDGWPIGFFSPGMG